MCPPYLVNTSLTGAYTISVYVPNINEYNLQPDASGIYSVVPSPLASGVLYAEYATSTNVPEYIQLQAVLNSMDGKNTPTLRAYKIDNLLK